MLLKIQNNNGILQQGELSGSLVWNTFQHLWVMIVRTVWHGMARLYATIQPLSHHSVINNTSMQKGKRLCNTNIHVYFSKLVFLWECERAMALGAMSNGARHNEQWCLTQWAMVLGAMSNGTWRDEQWYLARWAMVPSAIVPSAMSNGARHDK